jgi:hypothetical protein
MPSGHISGAGVQIRPFFTSALTAGERSTLCPAAVPLGRERSLPTDWKVGWVQSLCELLNVVCSFMYLIE